MVAAALVRRYGCRVVGLDQSAEMLGGAEAKLRADPKLAARVELVRGQAESLPFVAGEFDHLTFTYLLRYVEDPATTLGELARVVKPGGRVASRVMRPPNWRRAHSGASTGARPARLRPPASRDWYRSGGSWSQISASIGARHSSAS
jgi:demethylmenaquinone methyltransferase/2-methoxy-6-polyprenyl-1,4-benzoquinol methylase